MDEQRAPEQVQDQPLSSQDRQEQEWQRAEERRSLVGEIDGFASLVSIQIDALRQAADSAMGTSDAQVIDSLHKTWRALQRLHDLPTQMDLYSETVSLDTLKQLKAQLELFATA